MNLCNATLIVTDSIGKFKLKTFVNLLLLLFC